MLRESRGRLVFLQFGSQLGGERNWRDSSVDSHCVNSEPGSGFSALHRSMCTYEMNMRGRGKGILVAGGGLIQLREHLLPQPHAAWMWEAHLPISAQNRITSSRLLQGRGVQEVQAPVSVHEQGQRA